MQDRQLIDEIIKEWNGVLPQSYGEAYSQGIEKGEEKGIRQATYEFARRMIQDGVPDSDVQKYTQLPLDEIEKLRNGGGTG